MLEQDNALEGRMNLHCYAISLTKNVPIHIIQRPSPNATKPSHKNPSTYLSPLLLPPPPSRRLLTNLIIISITHQSLQLEFLRIPNPPLRQYMAIPSIIMQRTICENFSLVGV